jgi:dGTPase
MWPNIELARQAHEVQRRLITRSIVDVIDTAKAGLRDLRPETAEDVRLAGRTIVRFSGETAEAEQGLKRFMFDHVYRSEAVMAPIRKSQDVLGALFDLYIAGAPMPGRWSEAFAAAEGEGTRARVVADFVAGMTDPYALEEFTRLFDGPGEFR